MAAANGVLPPIWVAGAPIRYGLKRGENERREGVSKGESENLPIEGRERRKEGFGSKEDTEQGREGRETFEK